jgi:quinol---cytochrome c reductase cytochrome c subunit, bacillus type
MARDDTPLDQETFDRVLAEEVGKGADRRVAEGRARAAALRAARAKSGEGPTATPAPSPAAGDGGAPEPAAASAAAASPSAAPAPAAAAPAATAAPAAAAAAPAAAAAAAAAAAPASVATATLTAPERQAPAPTGNVPEPKKGAPEKHRLLALVPPEGIQRVEREQGDRINVWPHLLIEEFVAMMIVLAALTIFATFVNAPLRELANPNLTPNPSKAPWYFLGLQELLRYFHPMVAGVLFAPTLVLLALAVAPYVDRNPSTKPGDRKIAITLFTMLIMFGAVLTIIGSFFRGTGYNWVWPWAQGVFFDL